MLERATCRQDVQYVIGELIGELNTSHTYVFGGDVQRAAPQVGVGLLGADYEIDAAANLYRFKKIYGDVNWNDDGWNLNANPIDNPNRWIADNQVVSRN